MPRDGSGVYSAPAGTTATTNTTIESSKHNAWVADVEADANAARPVTAGGTGSTSASAAATALSVVSYGSAQTLSAAEQEQARSNVSAALKGHIFGLTLSNNATDATNDIDIAAGEAASTGSSPVLMVLASAITKRLDAAWAVGTGNGGLDTGSIAADTNYYVYLIRRPDTGVVDAIFSTSGTSPTMPTNYTQYRRIGWFRRVSTAIWGFTQIGDDFTLSSPFLAFSGGSFTTSRSLQPTNLAANTFAKLRVTFSSSTTGVAVSVVSPYETDAAVSFGAAPNNLYYGGAGNTNSVDAGEIWVQTNASAFVAVRANAASTSVTAYVAGWVDDRGRNG